jgi:hypothetical protein
LRVAQQRPGTQSELRQLIESQPLLLAHWLRHADASLADAELASMGASAPGFFDSLPEEARLPLLDRWIALPSAAGAVGYMETRNGGGTEVYWRQLANYYAKAGDKARAVGMVAQAEGVALDGSLPAGEFSRQLTALQEQGNEVAVRRLLKEAADAEKADPDKLRVALASYAAAGDWEMAWKAASRLVTATKNRQ